MTEFLFDSVNNIHYQLTLMRRLMTLEKSSSSVKPRVLREPVIVPTREPVIVPALEPVIVPVREPVMVPVRDPVIVPVRDPEALVLEPVIVPA